MAMLLREAPRDPSERTRRAARRRALLQVLHDLEMRALQAAMNEDGPEATRLGAMAGGVRQILTEAGLGLVDPDASTAGYDAEGAEVEPMDWPGEVA